MSPLRIRPYQAADRDAVISLWKDCGLVVPQNDPHKDIARKLSVDPKGFLVGESDDRIVATCMAGYEGHRGWINYLAVAPECQRRGFARQIMEAAEALLRQAGCPKINLQVRSTNAAVIDFYKAIGFTEDNVLSFGKRLVHDGPPAEPAPAGIEKQHPPRVPRTSGGIELVPCDALYAAALFEAAVESRAEISRWMPWCHEGYSIEDALNWTHPQPAAWAAGSGYEFVIVDRESKTLVGACGINFLNIPNRFANLGYWIRSSQTGKGYASEAAKLAANFAFTELGLVRVEIVAAVGNLASQRVAEKAGAMREGVLRNRLLVGGVALDAVMFSLVPNA